MPSIYTDSSAGASSYSAVPTARRRSGKKFLALVQGHARECFEQAGLIDVYSRMRWTVFEDAAGLDGADIAETSRRFIDLVQRGPGGEELAGSAFTSIIGGTPRHEFFLHVDEESLESVVDDAKAKEKSGYFCTVVMPGNVVLWEIKRDREGIYRFCEDGREVEEDEMWDLRKRVRIDDPVSLYAELHVSLDLWYCLLSFPDNPDIFVP
ncbi:hypothetical protein N657DRAFT_631721 [Parathielavia appendiculata]|uniref:Uncharacterized protein n=1 Tax=Parathielavia appendiculata TaxID=2587402 RepID=A0AAN6Z4X7_9PEZI|nr:hypothetical protein N657DRAFT_631721 [Parathielavia appendiculata]